MVTGVSLDAMETSFGVRLRAHKSGPGLPLQAARGPFAS